LEQHEAVRERTLEITFREPGAELVVSPGDAHEAREILHGSR
jgi:hypothetical protein